MSRPHRSRSQPSKAEQAKMAKMARLFAPAEPEPRRVTLWQTMAHRQGTCGGPDAGCPHHVRTRRHRPPGRGR